MYMSSVDPGSLRFSIHLASKSFSTGFTLSLQLHLPVKKKMWSIPH